MDPESIVKSEGVDCCDDDDDVPPLLQRVKNFNPYPLIYTRGNLLHKREFSDYRHYSEGVGK